MAKIRLKNGVWANSVSLIIGGAGAVTAANSTHLLTTLIGAAGVVFGVALFAWGITVDGEHWWSRDRIKMTWPYALLIPSLAGLMVSGWGIFENRKQPYVVKKVAMSRPTEAATTELAPAPSNSKTPDGVIVVESRQPQPKVHGHGKIHSTAQPRPILDIAESRARIRELLNGVDVRIVQRIDDGFLENVTRITEEQYRRLLELKQSPAGEKLVLDATITGTLIDSTINNGTLGPTTAEHTQYRINLAVSAEMRE